MKNLSLRNITESCRGTYHGNEALLDKEVTNVVIDSRKVEKDNLFVAINGETFNAHQFIPETIKSGALCVVSHEDLGDTDFPYILVESTSQALLDIAQLYRESFDIKVVGITGSVGKTSTKEMVASVLAQKYKVHKTLGNFNNDCGLPLTVFGLREEHEVAVLEMGVNHFGEMRKLSTVAQPDVCVMTNIGVAHLEFFKTKEGILQEKSEMLQDMKNGGTIILNGDDELLSSMGMVKGTEPIFYGLGDNSQFYATDIKPEGLKGTSCQIHLPDGSSFTCTVPIPGAHMVLNALAGTAVGYTLELTTDEIKAGIENLPMMPGRNNIIKGESLIVLDDCYNANPVSMKASIDVLNLGIGRKVAILGDMGELGDTTSMLHGEVGEYAAENDVDVLCAIGPISKAMADSALSMGAGCEVHWFETKEEFLAEAKNILQMGDNVLIKASHGMEFPVLVEALEKMNF